MKKTFALMTLIVLFFAQRAPARETKTVIRDGKFRIEVTREYGDTILKFSDGRSRRFDFQGKIKIVSQRKLTRKMLVTRRNKFIYIERVKGKVINNRLDGRTSTGGYISYRSLKGKVNKGNRVTTYYIYNPYTMWIDDIVERYDVVNK